MAIKAGAVFSLTLPCLFGLGSAYGQTTIVWSEDFENGWGSWYADGGVWDVGAVIVGPDTILPPGENVAGTNLSDNYPPNTNSRLISPEIKLPEIEAGEELHFYFWHWYKINFEGFYGPDSAGIFISVEGKSWVQLGEKFSRYSPVWTQVVKDLTPYANKSIRIAFHFYSNNAYQDLGWYLDNLMIIKGPSCIWFKNPEDFESGVGDWSAEYGLWEVGKPEWGTAHSGKNCAATVLKGNYLPYAYARMTSPFITLKALPGETPRLSFYHKFRIDKTGFYGPDSGLVQISTDGLTWHTVDGPITGISETWSRYKVPLSSYAESTVKIGFLLMSNRAYEDLGWYIDDIRIDGIDSTYLDSGPPTVSDIQIVPDSFYVTDSAQLSASIADHGYCTSNIVLAEYFIDSPDTAGTGRAMTLSTSNIQVEATATIAGSEIGLPGTHHLIYVHAQDAAGHWSELASVMLYITPQPPDSCEIVIPDACSAPGSHVTIPVYYKKCLGIAGAKIKLTYRSNILEAEYVTQPEEHGYTVADTIFPGKWAIAFARATGLAEDSGTLFYLHFKVSESAIKDDTTMIKFAIARFYDENTNPIPVNTDSCLFTVGPSPEIDNLVVNPGSSTLIVGEKLVLTATGYRQGKPVEVNPPWKVDTLFGNNIGYINPIAGDTIVFTATGAGYGLVIATQGDKSDSAVIVVGKTRGDINLDDIVDVQDGIMCLQIIVGNLHPNPYQLWAADCDGSGGSPDEADVLCILHECLDAMLPKGTFYSGPVQVILGTMEKCQNGLIAVPVRVGLRSDLVAGGFEISYDQDKLAAVTVVSSRSATLLASNLKEPGLVRVSSVNMESLLNGKDEWCTILFRSSSALKSLPSPKFEKLRLFDAAAKPVMIDVLEDAKEDGVKPTQYQLYQNHPNPFNPGTKIRFDLPVDSHVEVGVYNATGQLVTSLINGNQKAGAHEVQWNSRDSAGNQVPAGVYFYRMIVDHSAWSKVNKMILLK